MLEPIDHGTHRRYRDAKRTAGLESVKKVLRAGGELTGRKDVRRDRRNEDVRGQHRRILKVANGALGVDQHHVVALVDLRIAQRQLDAHRPVDAGRQPGLERALGCIGSDQVEASIGIEHLRRRARRQRNGRDAILTNGALGYDLRQAVRRPSGNREIARKARLDVRVDHQHAHAEIGQQCAKIGGQCRLADATLGRNRRKDNHKAVPSIGWCHALRHVAHTTSTPPNGLTGRARTLAAEGGCM